MIHKIRPHLIFLALAYGLLTSGKLAGQVKPQNVYRVSVSSWYKIEDGKRTPSYFTLSQHIYDSLGRLHTEVFWDRETQKPTEIRWHFFSDKAKMKTFFLNEKAVYRIEEYIYDNLNRVNRVTYKNVINSDTLVQQVQVRKFDAAGKLTKTEIYDPKGKRGCVVSHRFDGNNTETERRVKGKKIVPADSVLLLSRNVSYDSLNRIVREDVKITKHGNRHENYSRTYRYNPGGNLAEELVYGGSNDLKLRKEYTYRNDGRLWQVHHYNAQGELVEFIAWRYELYKTNNRRERILE